MRKERKILIPVSQEELEENYYQLLMELKKYGLSDIEISEVVNELSEEELKELINQLKKESL